MTAANISNIYKEVPRGLVTGQMIQTGKKSYNLRIVIDDLYEDRFDQILLKEVLLRFGNDAEVNLDHVEKIERSMSGKFRSIINEYNIS